MTYLQKIKDNKKLVSILINLLRQVVFILFSVGTVLAVLQSFAELQTIEAVIAAILFVYVGYNMTYYGTVDL